MDFIIKELDEAGIEDVGQIDGRFVIDSQLMLHAENNQIRSTVIDLPPREKRYAQEKIDYSAYMADREKAVFLAYVDEDIAGQIILRKNWNKYAYIEDIAVDVKFRRLGVGRALIDRARQWARQRGLPGIMLETQTNNVGACRFYESCGFKIGGFDNLLYRGLDADTDEAAVFYYLHFEAQVRE
jgi:ribosomal protein S18 acetylase RimI-like enzyme